MNRDLTANEIAWVDLRKFDATLASYIDALNKGVPVGINHFENAIALHNQILMEVANKIPKEVWEKYFKTTSTSISRLRELKDKNPEATFDEYLSIRKGTANRTTEFLMEHLLDQTLSLGKIVIEERKSL